MKSNALAVLMKYAITSAIGGIWSRWPERGRSSPLLSRWWRRGI